MTTELVLLLAVYVFIFAGIFSKDSGPLVTFKNSTPRLAAKVEKNLSIGYKFTLATTKSTTQWIK